MLHRLLTGSKAVASVAAALLLSGCGSAEPVDAARAPIVNGEPSVEADNDVVEVTSRPTGGTPQACSGTLVAPNIVLTALHCVATYSGGDFSCNPDGTLMTSIAGGGMLGQLAEPGQIEIRVGLIPGKDPDAYGAKLFGTGTNQICRNDLALVVLDRDLDLPLAAMRLERGVELGELNRVIGYGASENTTTSAGRMERAGVRIIDRGMDAGGSKTGTAAPRTVVVGQGPCHGDSGGPLLSEETGAVVGVYSLVSGASCTSIGVRNVYTRLQPFAALIQSAFDFAAQTPILEPGAGNGAGGGAAEGGDSSSGGGDLVGGATSVAGAATAGTGTRPGGSGSSQDGSCACRAAGTRPRAPLALGALALLGIWAVRRRAAASR